MTARYRGPRLHQLTTGKDKVQRSSGMEELAGQGGKAETKKSSVVKEDRRNC